jgi:hypothetical protein
LVAAMRHLWRAWLTGDLPGWSLLQMRPFHP